MPNVCVVVVARAGAGAKSRLAGVLSTRQRQALVLAMLADVLATCHATPAVAEVIAVTHWSVTLDARTLRVDDPAEGDMNAAVSAGIARAVADSAETVIVLPADIPCLATSDVAALLSAADRHARAVVVGASRDGQGTNALLLRPPQVIAPSFGPPSVARHVALAASAQCHTVVLRDLALALDIDTPEDLATLQSKAKTPPRTADFLATLTAQQ